MNMERTSYCNVRVKLGEAVCRTSHPCPSGVGSTLVFSITIKLPEINSEEVVECAVETLRPPNHKCQFKDLFFLWCSIELPHLTAVKAAEVYISFQGS